VSDPLVEPRAADRPVGAVSEVPARPLRVLLVEDDPSDAELVAESLSRAVGARMQTTRVRRLSEAVAHLRSEGADVALVDLYLPDSRGIDSALRLLQEAPSVPVVVMTGLEDDAVAARAVSLGAQDFLVKGRFDGEVLARALRYAVERRGMLSRLERAVAEARANEANLRNVIGRSVEGIVVLDADRVVRFVNPAAQALFQRPPEELPTAFPWSAVVPGDSREVSVDRPGAAPVPVALEAVEIEWERAPALLVSLYDLTDRKRGERVRLVQDVQRAFQPERRASQVPGLWMAGLNELCEDASGDYYDFLDLPGDRHAVVVGDVSGHGLEAALVMAQGRGFLRALVRTSPNLPEAVRHLNQSLAGDLTHGRFMTLFVAALDPRDGHMEWVNAGHQPALLYHRSGGAVERLAATGLVLGVVRDADYPGGAPCALAPGDVLLGYTDGATDARRPDGARFGDERLADSLRRHAGAPPAPLLDAIRADLLDWTGGRPLEDDLTLVAMGRAPAPA
jgi:DNA-binding NarL/FixJ family response regulator